MVKYEPWFYAAYADSTAQTGHAGGGNWQEEIYQMVIHNVYIIIFDTPFVGTF
jgi:Fe-S cluster assembly ATPase SufC